MAVHNWKYGFQSYFIFNLLKRKFYQIYFGRFWMILLNVQRFGWELKDSIPWQNDKFHVKTKTKVYSWQKIVF